MNHRHLERSGRPMMLAIVLGALLALPLAARQVARPEPAAPEPIDLDAVYRIKDEGFRRSQLMDVMGQVTDVYGSRLAGSPYRPPLIEYLMRTLEGWGLTNVHAEPVGEFARFRRGWANERFAAHVVSGQPYPLVGYPKPWSPGTQGTITAPAAIAAMRTEEDFEKYRGTLKGKIALMTPSVDLVAPVLPLARRYTDADLAALARQPDPYSPEPDTPDPYPFMFKAARFLADEGVVAAFDAGPRAFGTTLVTMGGTPEPTPPVVPTFVTIAAEQYNRIFRTLERGIPVTIELNVQNRFVEPAQVVNLIAELPGSDKAGETVILGAHWDSWHAGTGACDDAAGFVTMMEAARILKASGLRMRRTVRLALWDAEEQGMWGSRAYVAAHFLDPRTRTPTPEHAKLAAYFVMDYGTALIRGVNLQGNEAAAPILRRWMEPFRNMGMATAAIRSVGRSDHVPFDAVGLPAFPFIQDPSECDATYHSNMDVYERLRPADLMQNAVIVASFVYHAANRDEPLPRKPAGRPRAAS